jgi:dTDP-4-dehydrorhamnose 3,5-epimerase
MRFIKTELEGAYVVEPEPFQDFRGTFARVFCTREFRENKLSSEMVQTNFVHTYKKHTLRGLHYQAEGAEEDKLIQCVRGSILDVLVDIRKNSETFGRHISIELSERNGRMVYVPRRFAHGYISLEDNSSVIYQVTNFYAPGKEKGIRWNDPFFKIVWPTSDPILSEKDSNFPDYELD